MQNASCFFASLKRFYTVNNKLVKLVFFCIFFCAKSICCLKDLAWMALCAISFNCSSTAVGLFCGSMSPIVGQIVASQVDSLDS